MYMYIVFADIDECLSEPCENNGTCVDGAGGHTCICTALFTGHNCESGADKCIILIYD